MKKRFGKSSQKIAVVGMAGLFPQAPDTDHFLRNVLEKKSCVVPVPGHRWVEPVADFISSAPQPDKAISRMAGIIEEIKFDPGGFNVAPEVLAGLDPVHHLVLEAGRSAFLQCSHTTDQLRRTGVILAAIALPTRASSLFSNQVLFGDNPARLSQLEVSRNGMVSYPAAILCRAMGFEAGSFTLDAACASSLFSIKLACEQLAIGKADIMLAGGVSRPDSLYTQIGFSQLQALSPSGTCAPFDASADGLVVGEGAGIVVLKRLEDALHSGDTIHAVVTGAGVSNDIEGTLVGPASEGQVRAMKAAYEQAGWSPEDIQYMECHGSGTPVGDQVELTSIKALLEEFSCPDAHLSIGSVKSMTGHLLTAAGAAGFIKTVLSMGKGVLPPSLNFTAPAKKSPMLTSNIRVQTRPEEWKPAASDTPRKAAVSAFGFGGINAHILLEEYSKETKIYPAAGIKGENSQLGNTALLPCAIVGMEAITRDCNGLDQLKNVLSGTKIIEPAHAGERWRRPESDSFRSRMGYYIKELGIELGRFHIPPNQMDEILLQHLLLLKAVGGSLEDAGISPRPAEKDRSRRKMGCAIGIDFDYGAADFFLRWQLNSEDDVLKDKTAKPLNFNRTLGALGGIVASRVAREFKLGGPCFTLSAREASGIKTIETARHSLSSYETDTFLCGCVDLAGDIRQYILDELAGTHDNDNLPAEGAAAIVLKRYDQALADNDRIYGVITGIGAASGSPVPGEDGYLGNHAGDDENLSRRSFEIALESAGCLPSEIDLHENMQARYPAAMPPGYGAQQNQPVITSAASFIGYTGVASSLFSVISCAMALESGSVPKVVQADVPSGPPQKACIASKTTDGTHAHLILEACGQVSGQKRFSTKNMSGNDNRLKGAGRIALKSNSMILDPGTIFDVRRCLGIQNSLEHGADTEAPEHDSFDLIQPELIVDATNATSKAHEKFLEFSAVGMQLIEEQFTALSGLAAKAVQLSDAPEDVSHDSLTGHARSAVKADSPAPYLDRDMCLEYAVGKAGTVLGPEFDIIDTYPVRVRLPAEPLMLVDRIMAIEGEMLSLGPGKIVTQHDVKPGAWYLDGPKTPVSISIEAGQADLFLCAWLGIDHRVKGRRKYRLLDAKVTFHRTLPEPGETIEYHIEIDRFLKQGEIYLFFFHYKGYINDELFISMRDGCAGFFTEEEVENSGGIILTSDNTRAIGSQSMCSPLVPIEAQAFSDEQIQALRHGDPAAAFGPVFAGKTLGRSLRLPGGKMHLIDRVLKFDPTGGRFGLGSIVAQSDIDPDAWFLTCHFIDDMVMPGTLMYECCAHALRVFTQRFGWITDRDDVYYDVLPHNEADLKCRGPVTRQTRHARYEIEIKEMGYAPEPYVIADAHMFSDDLRIVLYKDMGMKLVGLTQAELEELWKN